MQTKARRVNADRLIGVNLIESATRLKELILMDSSGTIRVVALLMRAAFRLRRR